MLQVRRRRRRRRRKVTKETRGFRKLDYNLLLKNPKTPEGSSSNT